VATSVIPRGKGLTPYVRRALTITVRDARAVPLSQLRLEHFRQSKNKVMHWPPSRLDVDRIVQIVEAIKSPGRELPVVLDIGAGTGLLSFLIAQTGRAAVIGIDPSRELIEKSAYSHPNLHYVHAGIEWAIKNYAGEIDLAIWSWPLVALEPLKNLNALDPRGALLIFNLMHYRVGFGITDFIVYKYEVNFDDLGGFRKALLWRGVDCNAFARSDKGAYFSQDNLFVFYANEGLEQELSPPRDGNDARDYPWIEEARSIFTRFPLPSAVKLIGNSDILCPREVER
jgi:SAM-dependent methyltransferase